MKLVLEKEIKTFFSGAGRNDLFELTYAYTSQKDRFLNRTLFSEYAQCSPHATSAELISAVRKKLEADIALLSTYIAATEGKDRLMSFYGRTLHYTKRIYEMIWWSVPFEVQKRFPEDDYIAYGLEECLQQVKKIDKEIFGELVHEKSREVSRSECLLLNTYKLYSERLTDKEKAEYTGYVELLKTLPNYKEDICNLDLSTSLLDNPIFDCLIPRETYIYLFTLVFDFYKLDISVVVDERSSIYDGPDVLYIPNAQTYNFLPLRKVLKLIAHEIETHYLVLHNADQIVSGIKGAGNLSREEGLAIFQEFLLTGNELSEIDMSNNIPIILMGELVEGKEYLQFLNLYRKLLGIATTGADRLLRAKRNYPLWGIGVQHKDVSYSRGVYQVRNYLLQGGDFSDLFLAKVSFEDMAMLSHSVDNTALLFPKQVAMRLMFSLLAGGDQQIYNKFLQEISSKYPFLEKLLQSSFTKEEQELFKKIEQSLMSLLPQHESVT